MYNKTTNEDIEQLMHDLSSEELLDENELTDEDIEILYKMHARQFGSVSTNAISMINY